MAEPAFDVRAFQSRLATRHLGRDALALASVASTNDEVWARHAAGAPHGAVVVADAQVRGRGRAGRSWHTAPGLGLAMSLLVVDDGARRPLHLLPLAVGLAIAGGLGRLGATASLKWPNDVLVGGGKVAGVLIERRGNSGRPAAVVGTGINVSQRAADFPRGLAERPDAPPATSLALEGHARTREEVAAAYLNALEPLWEELGARGGAPIVAAWRAQATFWGTRVRVKAPGGTVEGVAATLDDDGRLVVETAGGPVAVMAGDVIPDAGGVEAQ